MSVQADKRFSASVVLDGLCVLLLLISVTVIGLTWRSGAGAADATRSNSASLASVQPPATIDAVPVLQTSAGPDGAPRARYDHAMLVRVCAEMGLPPPPDLNDADPVPVSVLFRALDAWSSKRDATALGEAGRMYVALGLEDAALPLFLAAAELDAPRRAFWRYFAGVCCQRIGHDEAAVHLLERAAAEDQSHPVVNARLATLALDSGNLDRAEALFRAYRAARPDDSLGSFGLAQVALARGNAPDAVSLLEDALRARPNDSRAARLYARALALTGRIEESRAASTHAAAMPEYFGWMAFDDRLREAHAGANTITHARRELQRLTARQDWARAAALAEEIHRRQPSDASLLANLAAIYSRLGRGDEALNAAQYAVRLDPRNIQLQQVLAEVALTQRQYDISLAACDAVLAVEPRASRLLDIKSRALLMSGDHSGAFATITRAIEQHPDVLALRMTLAALLQHTGRFAEAATVLEDVLRRDPSNQVAAQQLAGIRQRLQNP